MAKGRRKFPASFYKIGRSGSYLREFCFTDYVIAHPGEFGLSNLEGPFNVGPDLTGILDGQSVNIEVEKEYLTYLQHGHPIYDVLIVGVLDLPNSSMAKKLPKVIINLDSEKVLYWIQERIDRARRASEFKERCQCGMWAGRARYDPEKDGHLTDGQDLDMAMGFRAVIECESCGQRGWLQSVTGEFNQSFDVSGFFVADSDEVDSE